MTTAIMSYSYYHQQHSMERVIAIMGCALSELSHFGFGVALYPTANPQLPEQTVGSDIGGRQTGLLSHGPMQLSMAAAAAVATAIFSTICALRELTEPKALHEERHTSSSSSSRSNRQRITITKQRRTTNALFPHLLYPSSITSICSK